MLNRSAVRYVLPLNIEAADAFEREHFTVAYCYVERYIKKD